VNAVLLIALSVVACDDADPATPDGGVSADGAAIDGGARRDAGGARPDAGGAQPPLLFSSDWSTATGRTSAAFLDSSKPIPWPTSINLGEDQPCEILAATGLDFPTDNVFHIVATPVGEREAHSVAIRDAPDILPVPAVGSSRWFRVYVRVVADETVADPHTHPLEDGPGGGSTTNWAFRIYVEYPGAWLLNFWFNEGLGRQIDAPLLSKDVTYRVEWQVHRISETTFNFHARVYDPAGELLYGDEDFTFFTGGTGSLADSPAFTFHDVASMSSLKLGINGNVGEPVDEPFCYWGGFAISDASWIGPYVAGERP
jgi:hypothetical protein